VQSIAGGNTMVLNRAATKLVADASRRTGFVSHDWWTYQIVTGAGGVVHYSPEPLVDYRQHAGNIVGPNASLQSRFARYRVLLSGGFREWTRANIDGLTRCSDLLTADALRTLDLIDKATEPGALSRLRNLARSGAYRQTVRGSIGLYLAALINKL
jgi:hypothetical protein